MSKSPNSYKDPYWSDLADKASAKAGVPPEILKSLFIFGEKSNKDQVSEAGAQTVFQIIPSTRKLILDKYGIDPYLSDELAAEGAARLVKESHDRNKGNISDIAGEYHGGTDRKNWGPRTKAYIDRVNAGVASLDFDKWAAAKGFSSNSGAQISRVAQIGDDFDAAMAKKPSNKSAESETVSDTSVDVSAMLADLDQWEANKPAEAEPAQELGFLDGVAESITGSRRATDTTRTLPEWTGMPELNQMSMASAKTGLGTLVAAPNEIAQIIKANFPDAQIRQDEKGNNIIRSSVDGQEYAIPPGLSVGDIPRVIAGLGAFVPAAKAVSTLGMAGAKGLAAQAATSGAATAATQAAIEGSQAATGGNFSGTDVALAGLVGGATPPIMKGIQAAGAAIAQPVSRALSKLMGPKDARMAESAAANAAPAQPIAPAPVQAAPTATVQDIASTAKRATEGVVGKQKAADQLAEMFAPNKKTIEAAERMGTLDYLQPDHISTSQAARDIMQAAKTTVGSQGREAEVEGLKKVAEKADELISRLGGTKDLASVSSGVKKELESIHTTLKDKERVLHNTLKEKIGPSTTVSADTAIKFIEQRAKDLKGVKNLDPLEKEILVKLKDKPTYALLDAVTRKVGAESRMSSAFTSTDTGLAKNLYGLLNADRKIAAEAKGVLGAFDEANSATTLRKGIEDDLTALFGKNLDASIVTDINRATSALSKGDTSQFINLMKSVPEGMRAEVAASGINTVLNKNGVTSFSGYAKWYEGLLNNKQAHSAVMTSLPREARKSLSDLYRVSKGIADATKEKVGTGRVQTANAAFTSADSLAGKVYEAATNNMFAIGAGTVSNTIIPGSGSFVTGMLSSNKTPAIVAVDKLLSSPEFKAAVLKAANGKSPEAAKELAKSKVFSEFVFKIGNPGEMSNRERWILQALESNTSNLQQANQR